LEVPFGMVLVLTSEDVRGLVSMADAIEVTAAVVREEVAGTSVHMASFGGQNARPRGLPPALGTGSGGGSGGVLRVVGGAGYGIGRAGVRAGGVALVFDTDGNRLVAIVPSGTSSMRLAACMGLAARHLSRAESRAIGLLGSGRNSLPSLQGLCAVRPIERVAVYSRNAEHRARFATRATEALGIPVTPVDSVEAAVDGADIIAGATSSVHPVIRAEHLQPGVHVSSMGEPHEIDASAYLRADQIVASSWEQQIRMIDPNGQRVGQRQGLEPAGLWQLLGDGRIRRDQLIELGAIVAGQVAPRVGRTAISIFHESQGGIGDVALANLAYERARELGRGSEIDL
jgi:ornithine cyclodeaminase/alanine dehydrogenase-like protein (mu-crystallin family)